MNRPACLAAVLVLAACTSPSGDRAAGNDAAHFEKFKSLAGTWTSTGQTDAPAGAKVVYRVTAAGTAVEETVFAGSPHEMVTLYTLDRGRLVLTHYCALGNQPRMELQPPAASGALVFDCTSLGNGSVATDMHMHHAEFTFVDANRLESAWTMWKDGAASESVRFSLERAAD